MPTVKPQLSADPKDGMPVEAALEQLHRLSAGAHAPLKLVLPYESGFAMAGARPFKPVIGFHAGFDWDYGKIFVDVGVQMRAPSVELDQEAATLARAVGALGEIGLVLRNTRLTNEQKLRSIDAKISGFRTVD